MFICFFIDCPKKSKPLDIVFVLDRSNSIRAEDFLKIKSWVKLVIQGIFKLNSQSDLQIGVVLFG